MRELFNFIQKNIHWLLFLLLIVVAVVLNINNNQFQRSKYLAATYEVTGRVHSVTSAVESYINLKSENDALLFRIAELENEKYTYERKIELLESISRTEIALNDSLYTPQYKSIPGMVVYNNTQGSENYIQINKGSNDGIKRDMGVMSPEGIVGVIMEVSPHYSLAISVLNPKFQLNCKLKDKNYFGPLVWDGKDPRYTYLENLPRHADLEIGDTIVTSGFSAFFPEGLHVGIVIDTKKQKNDNYNSAKVKLATDFNTLKKVLIIENHFQEEQINLQTTTRK